MATLSSVFFLQVQQGVWRRHQAPGDQVLPPGHWRGTGQDHHFYSYLIIEDQEVKVWTKKPETRQGGT